MLLYHGYYFYYICQDLPELKHKGKKFVTEAEKIINVMKWKDRLVGKISVNKGNKSELFRRAGNVVQEVKQLTNMSTVWRLSSITVDICIGFLECFPNQVARHPLESVTHEAECQAKAVMSFMNYPYKSLSHFYHTLREQLIWGQERYSSEWEALKHSQTCFLKNWNLT